MIRIIIILLPIIFLALMLQASCMGLENACFVPDTAAYDAGDDEDVRPARTAQGVEGDLLDCAMEKTGAIPDIYERVGVMLEIARGCDGERVGGKCDAVLAGAEETAASIGGLRDRQSALLQVAMARADGGAYDEALALCGKLEPEDFKAGGLTHAAVKAREAGRDDLADEILSAAAAVGLGMPFDTARERVLMGVVQDLAAAGQHEQALAVAGMMDNGDLKDSAVEAIALGLIDDGQSKRAEKIIGVISDANRVCGVLDAAARRLIGEGRQGAAGAVIARLAAAAGKMESVEDGLFWRTAAALSYAELGNREKAAELLLIAREGAKEIEDARVRVSLLTDIAEALGRAGMKKMAQKALLEALSIAEAQEGSLFRDMLLSDVAAGHGAIGDFESALHIIETMGDDHVINGSLAGLSMRYAKEGLYDDAMMIASSLADPGERSAALVVIAMRLIGEDRLGKALAAIKKMGRGIEKADALLEAARACLEAGEVSRMRSALAEAALEARRISDGRARQDVIAGIVLTSFEGGAADLGIELLAQSGPGVKAIVLGRLAADSDVSKELIPSIMIRLHCGK